jgi:hypothetical protein
MTTLMTSGAFSPIGMFSQGDIVLFLYIID